MKENEKQNISIKIGDLKRMSMSIDPADEELIREAERYVNRVLEGMKRMFPDEGSREHTARTAFQFAKLYLAQYFALQRESQNLQEVEAELDSLLQLTAQGPVPSQNS